jgi:hypothetical protein
MVEGVRDQSRCGSVSKMRKPWDGFGKLVRKDVDGEARIAVQRSRGLSRDRFPWRWLRSGCWTRTATRPHKHDRDCRFCLDQKRLEVAYISVDCIATARLRRLTAGTSRPRPAATNRLDQAGIRREPVRRISVRPSEAPRTGSTYPPSRAASGSPAGGRGKRLDLQRMSE